MRRIIICGVLCVASGGPIGIAQAQTQTTQPTYEDLLGKLNQMDQRIQALEARHELEHQADRKKIQGLQSQITDLRQQGSIEARRAREIAEIREMAEEQATPPNPYFDLGSSGSAGGASLLNPDITVFFDMGVSLSSNGDNNALNRFNFREAELDFRGAISPAADGVFILTLGEEIEQEVDGSVDISRNVDIEEGYVNFHSLPHDLALKVGQFRPAFGSNNLLHTHDLPQVDRPLAVQNFLGPEGFHAIGASLSWLVPNPWDKYVEAIVQITNADGGESPLFGGANAENPAIIAHVKFFDDITPTSSIDLGASYLFVRTSADTDDDANVIGLDAAYTWTDPDPSKFRSVLVQAEAFWAQNDVRRGLAGLLEAKRNTSFGTYLFAQYQLSRDWYTGIRFDYTDFPDSEVRGPNDSDFAISPYVTWYESEFLRLRLEYQHRFFELDGTDGDEDALFLQMTFIVGAHPPHPYWVNR